MIQISHCVANIAAVDDIPFVKRKVIHPFVIEADLVMKESEQWSQLFSLTLECFYLRRSTRPRQCILFNDQVLYSVVVVRTQTSNIFAVRYIVLCIRPKPPFRCCNFHVLSNKVGKWTTNRRRYRPRYFRSGCAHCHTMYHHLSARWDLGKKNGIILASVQVWLTTSTVRFWERYLTLPYSSCTFQGHIPYLSAHICMLSSSPQMIDMSLNFLGYGIRTLDASEDLVICEF